jgi:Ca2+-binding RTX toxin-like protein
MLKSMQKLFGVSKNRGRATSHLGLERLDQRDLMSAVFAPVNRTVYIDGTNLQDEIYVHVDLNGAGLADDELVVQLSTLQAGGDVTTTENRFALWVVGNPYSIQNVRALDISGMGGDDVIHNATSLTCKAWGGSGNDTMYGGAGSDTMYGGNGNDYIKGFAGNDWLDGGNNNDTVSGAIGNDTVYGQAGNDELWGDDNYKGYSTIEDPGNDRILGGTGYNIMFGQAGNDKLYGGNNGNDMFGGRGDDWMEGGTLADFMEGGNGTDYMFGKAGNDYMWGDWLVGGPNLWYEGDADYMDGGSGYNAMYGQNGNDNMIGGNTGSSMNGGHGDDFIKGGNGADQIQGGDGSDHIWGYGGNDTLSDDQFGDYADGYVDYIIGGSGHDIIYMGFNDAWTSDGDEEYFQYT